MRGERTKATCGRGGSGAGTGGLAAAVAGVVTALVLLAGCQRAPEPAAGTGAASNPPPTASAGDPAAAATGATASSPASTGAGASTDASTTAAAPAADRAAQIAAAAAQWPKVEGRWTRGDTDSRYTAYFDGGRLRYLEEQMGMGDHGSRRQRYWFDDGALFYYEGRKPSDVPGGTKPGMLPPDVPVVAEFRGGDVVRAVAREHYGEKKLDDVTVSGIRNHAAALAGAAQDEWSAKQR